jgi:hypothetical protein
VATKIASSRKQREFLRLLAAGHGDSSGTECVGHHFGKPARHVRQTLRSWLPLPQN